MEGGFTDGSEGKEFTCKAEDLGLIPGLGKPLEKGIATHSSVLAFCFFLYCTNLLKSIHMTHLNSDYPFFKCSMPTKATILPSGHNSGQCRSTW